MVTASYLHLYTSLLQCGGLTGSRSAEVSWFNWMWSVQRGEEGSGEGELVEDCGVRDGARGAANVV